MEKGGQRCNAYSSNLKPRLSGWHQILICFRDSVPVRTCCCCFSSAGKIVQSVWLESSRAEAVKISTGLHPSVPDHIFSAENHTPKTIVFHTHPSTCFS